MHCRSCELLVEEELLKIKGITKAEVKHAKACAKIYYHGTVSDQELKQAVQKAGYDIGSNEKLPIISKNPSDYKELGIAVLIALVFVFLFFRLNLIQPASNTSEYQSFTTVLLIGLVAGFSTCMALIGGLVLGTSAKYAKENPELSSAQKFIPHLWFNIGRIVGFTVLGALIGTIGSILAISTSIIGLLTIAVAIVMLVLGGQLVNIFPRLSRISISLPTSLAKKLKIRERSSDTYSTTNTLLLGASTFFLPCGFTQAMQLFAIASGSALSGALIMGIFALGTAPGLLAVGGITSIVKGQFSRIFFKTAGIIIIVFALFNISNAITLFGLNSSIQATQKAPAKNNVSQEEDPNVKLVDGVQEVRMVQVANGYEPNRITVKKGVPVRWIITSEYPFSCASAFVVPKLNIQKHLTSEETVIEFTPTGSESIPFSCSMGMYRGIINITD